MSEYHWDLYGAPFLPVGRVLYGDHVIVRLEYEGQDERLLVERLAAITRTLKQVDKKRGRKP